ncbi:M48 family metallopeptidase [Streptomyces griseiscabiei]|uniref:M48 family metallopeptidase n=3 Tax=Streptomyces griseiscabiei TaxID=2993540 RepID=A0ABU4KYZ2_9ACTN|nr:M48 family metallopeptidase [Streptomyces griseiscabiei]MBZ3904860.1 M48 family metalloprotease [Streptomyces griseiscabiei]MDX2908612.1 M48 family metallopeptidase [Streptomyces griseiscabiei]
MTDPRAGAPPALPHPTSTQFLLLLLMVSAASLFTGTWWGVLTRDGWTARREACLRRAAGTARAVGTAAGDLGTTTRCLDDLLLRESAVSLLGPVVVLALAALAVLVTTGWRLRRWHRRPLPVPARTTAALKSCLAEAGHAPAVPPRAVVERRGGLGGVREEARAYGLFARQYVVLANHTPLSWETSPDEDHDRVAMATLRHEVAHLRAGDVGRGRFAFHVLWLFPCVVVLPLAVAAIGRPANLALSLGWRLAAVTAVVLLAFAAFVRTREYEADHTADTAPADPGGMAFAVRRSVALEVVRRRLPGVPRPAALLRLHPDGRSRLRVLEEPGRPHRLLLTSCLIAGIAVGAAFQEIALLLEAATAGDAFLAHWLTGLLTGTAVAAVVSVSVWRDGHGTGDALRSGALLGLALVVGSQLSPRAAGAWERLFPTALVRGDHYALLGARPVAVLPLVTVAVLGGAVFVAWSRALAPVRLRTAPGPRVLIVLAGLVLSVPLAVWFQLQRLVATSYVPPRAVGRLLLTPVVYGGLCAGGVLALVVLWTAWRRPWRSTALAGACTCVCAAALLPIGAVTVGTVIDRRVPPDPPLTRPTDDTGRARDLPDDLPEGELPVLPSATGPGRHPAVEPALACFVLLAAPTADLRTRDGLREVLEQMRVTRDANLRAVVLRVLEGLESDPGFDTGAAVREVHAACKVVLAR